MKPARTEGGASAPSNVLQFPERNKGRKRRAASMDAAGALSLRIMARDGEQQPPNVVRIDAPPLPTDLPQRTPALALALCVFSTLTAKQKADAREFMRQMAFDGDPSAVRLVNLFATYDTLARRL